LYEQLQQKLSGQEQKLRAAGQGSDTGGSVVSVCMGCGTDFAAEGVGHAIDPTLCACGSQCFSTRTKQLRTGVWRLPCSLPSMLFIGLCAPSASHQTSLASCARRVCIVLASITVQTASRRRTGHAGQCSQAGRTMSDMLLPF
jgi:hypothetical protein